MECEKLKLKGILHTLSSPRPDPYWTCPDNQIRLTDATDEAALDDGVTYSPPCYVPRPKITQERHEMWLNPYGQVVSIRYLDVAHNKDTIFIKMPETESEVVSNANWDSFYIDTDGAVVSYYEKQVIPSNRIVKSPITYPPGYGAEQTMNGLGLSKREFMDVANYELIKQEAYNHSPEYQAQKIKELEEELANAKMGEVQENVARLNETVTQHSTWFNSIFNWIYENFGIDLR